MSKLLVSLLVAGAVAGCSLAPQYVRPEPPVAAAYPADPNGRIAYGIAHSVPRSAAEIGWREFFPDPRLQALITTALDQNRDLRSAALRIEEARAQYNIQSADLWPNLNLNASESRRRPAAQWSAGHTRSGSTWRHSNWISSDACAA